MRTGVRFPPDPPTLGPRDFSGPIFLRAAWCPARQCLTAQPASGGFGVPEANAGPRSAASCAPVKPPFAKRQWRSDAGRAMLSHRTAPHRTALRARHAPPFLPVRSGRSPRSHRQGVVLRRRCRDRFGVHYYRRRCRPGRRHGGGHVGGGYSQNTKEPKSGGPRPPTLTLFHRSRNSSAFPPDWITSEEVDRKRRSLRGSVRAVSRRSE